MYSETSSYRCVAKRSALKLALHYDLRMQLDGSTFSWAIPKGLIGKKIQSGSTDVKG